MAAFPVANLEAEAVFSRFFAIGERAACYGCKALLTVRLFGHSKGDLRLSEFSAFLPAGAVGKQGLSRNVRKPDQVPGDEIVGHEVERRTGAGEVWGAASKHDGVEVESILIDKAGVG